MTTPSLSRLVIPDEWRPVIAQVDAMFPGAVLCGGALRDLVWGKQDAVKDLDFVIGQPYRGLFDARALHPQTWFLTDVFNGNYFGFRQDVVSVERYDIGGGLPSVELIYLDAPVKGLSDRVAARNDFGCCQITYGDPHGFGHDFYYSEAFLDDATNNRFTLINCEDATQAERSIRRAERWRAKYPDIEMDLSAAHRQLAMENSHAHA